MNDDELITTVKKSVTDVHMNIPAEQIVNRSRTIRARRRIPGAAAALAIVAGAALTVTTLLPSSHPASAQLAAWTVARQANGAITVTIRELSDPAGLQSTLRADGVPASVTFSGQENPACRRYPSGGGTDLLGKAVSVRPEGRSTLMIINPSALPSGAGLQFASLAQHQGTIVGVRVALVQASPQCTGS
jgi:hypothetical protein